MLSAQPTNPQRRDDAGDEPSQLLRSLLARVDENLICQPLLDNDAHGIDTSKPRLFQLPSAVALQTHLAALEAANLPWAPPLFAMVDALFRHLVRTAADRPSGDHDAALPADVVSIVDHLAAMTASLAAQAAEPFRN
jgi:hypothetical protein